MKKKKIVKRQSSKNNNENTINELEHLEKKIHIIEEQMKEYGTDHTKLNELHQEKKQIQENYDELYLTLEE